MVEGTNKKLVQDIASALAAGGGDPALKNFNKVSRSRGAIPATLGTGFEGATAAGDGASGEGGATGDLTEQSASTRTFHTIPRQISSTDGVFQIEIRDIKTVQMQDDNGNITVFEFAQPN